MQGRCSPIKLRPRMVGAAGIEPATSCSQSRRAASALRSDAVTLPCCALLYLAEPFRATHWRALLHFALPSKISKAASPTPTAPATTKVKTSVFRPITGTSRPHSRQRPVVISKMEHTASCGRCRSGNFPNYFSVFWFFHIFTDGISTTVRVCSGLSEQRR